MSKHSLLTAGALILPILIVLSSCHQASSYEIYTGAGGAGAGGGGGASKGGGAGQAGSLEAGADSGGTGGEADEEAAGTSG